MNLRNLKSNEKAIEDRIKKREAKKALVEKYEAKKLVFSGYPSFELPTGLKNKLLSDSRYYYNQQQVQDLKGNWCKVIQLYVDDNDTMSEDSNLLLSMAADDKPEIMFKKLDFLLHRIKFRVQYNNGNREDLNRWQFFHRPNQNGEFYICHLDELIHEKQIFN